MERNLDLGATAEAVLAQPINRRGFFRRLAGATIAAPVGVKAIEGLAATLVAGAVRHVTRRIVEAAERATSLVDRVITDPRVDAEHPFAIFEAWPDSVQGTNQGTLTQYQGVGLEEFFSTEAGGGSPLPELTWLKVSDIPLNPKGEIEIPDNTGFTFDGIPVNGETGRTEVLWLRLKPHEILFISAGEIELHPWASRFSMDNGADHAVAKFLQIDAKPGETPNPHGNNIYIIAGDDPVIGVRLAVPGNAVAIQFKDKYGKGLVDQEQLKGQASLDRSVEDTVATAVRLNDGAWKSWVFKHGPKANSDQERREVPDGAFQPVAGNVQ